MPARGDPGRPRCRPTSSLGESHRPLCTSPLQGLVSGGSLQRSLPTADVGHVPGDEMAGCRTATVWAIARRPCGRHGLATRGADAEPW